MRQWSNSQYTENIEDKKKRLNDTTEKSVMWEPLLTSEQVSLTNKLQSKKQTKKWRNLKIK